MCSRKKENADLQNWQEEKKPNNKNMSEDERCQDGRRCNNRRKPLSDCLWITQTSPAPHSSAAQKHLFCKKMGWRNRAVFSGELRESEGFVCAGAGRVQRSTWEARLRRRGTSRGSGLGCGTGHQPWSAQARPRVPKLYLLKSSLATNTRSTKMMRKCENRTLDLLNSRKPSVFRKTDVNKRFSCSSLLWCWATWRRDATGFPAEQ